eukprot:7453248-Alexandrium_andersonii.AAC.1
MQLPAAARVCLQVSANASDVLRLRARLQPHAAHMQLPAAASEDLWRAPARGDRMHARSLVI